MTTCMCGTPSDATPCLWRKGCPRTNYWPCTYGPCCTKGLCKVTRLLLLLLPLLTYTTYPSHISHMTQRIFCNTSYPQHILIHVTPLIPPPLSLSLPSTRRPVTQGTSSCPPFPLNPQPPTTPSTPLPPPPPLSLYFSFPPPLGALSLKALALVWVTLLIFLLLANAATDSLWTSHWSILLLPLVTATLPSLCSS